MRFNEKGLNIGIMLFNFFYISVFILCLSSCALFKPQNKMDVDQALNSILILGEGRGRLGIEGREYLFGFDALIKNDIDWILAVNVPLHGEEIMILRDIRMVSSSVQKLDSFEIRIQNEINSMVKEGQMTGEDYVRELRSVIRFVLAPQLLLTRTCENSGQGVFKCTLEQDIFTVRLSSGSISVKKEILQDYFLELTGENLTDSFFRRTNVHLRSQSASTKAPSILSLELFWK